MLVLARKNAAHQCAIETPLTLHVGKTITHKTSEGKTTAGSPRWSAQALRFCPWLG